MEKKHNSLNNLLLAFIGGAALGAILGVLFAPAKGKETRSKAAGALKGFSENMTDKFKGQDAEDTENKT